MESSVAIKGTFKKWDATLTFTSPDVTTAVLDINIQAGSVQVLESSRLDTPRLDSLSSVTFVDWTPVRFELRLHP